MLKSGGKLVGVGVVSMAVGAVLAMQTDSMHGSLRDNAIRASILLCLAGAAIFLFGLYKVIVGLATHK